MLVGAVYKKPDLLIEWGQYIKPKYDFDDDATRFLYECATVMYDTRFTSFNKTNILTFMAQDEERLKKYKQLGGWNLIQSWMKLAVDGDETGYFNVLKKYSLLREYQRNGFNVDKIMALPKFELYKAENIYQMIRAKADRINTVILTNSESEVLNEKIQETVNGCLESPDMGIQIPYPIMNDLFRGIKLGTMMCTGMLSNAGKSRYMFKLIAYIALVKKEKVFVMLNEMTVEEMRFCLLTTVINNPEFQELHGIHINKKEREITLGLYHDAKGELIYRNKDEWGDFTESLEDYTHRVGKESEEYRKIIEISKWIEDQSQGMILAKDVCQAYDDRTLSFEIKKANLTNGIKYVFYDTLKSDVSSLGDWSQFKATATRLSEIAKENNVFIYGSIQLGDDANAIRPDELSSSHIASCKQIKHVLHTLVLFKEVPQDMFKRYGYISDNADWGTPSVHDLNPDKRYYCGVVDKNRFGSKAILLFEVNLDYNTWTEVGKLVRK